MGKESLFQTREMGKWSFYPSAGVEKVTVMVIIIKESLILLKEYVKGLQISKI